MRLPSLLVSARLIIALATVSSLLTAPGRCQSLPKPDDVSINTTGALSVSGAVSDDALPPAAEARQMAARTAQSLDAIAQRLQANIARMDGLISERDECARAPDQLRAEKAAMIREMQQGLYCSQCRRSKSEIERSGESFAAHLQRVGGVAVPASPEEIAQKAKGYDQQIADAVQQYQACYQRTTNEHARLEQQNRRGYEALRQGIRLWQTATTLEQNLLTAHEEAARARDAQQTATAQDALRQIAANRAALQRAGKLDKAQARMLEAGAANWQRLITQIATQANLRTSAYFDAQRTATANRDQEYATLLGAVQRAQLVQGYASRMGEVLPTLTVPLGDASITSAPNQLGVNFDFGAAMSGTLEARNEPTGTEVQTFVTLFKSVRVGVGWRTQYSPAGVTSGPMATLKLAPQNPDGQPVKPHLPKPDLPKPGVPKPGVPKPDIPNT